MGVNFVFDIDVETNDLNVNVNVGDDIVAQFRGPIKAALKQYAVPVMIEVFMEKIAVHIYHAYTPKMYSRRFSLMDDRNFKATVSDDFTITVMSTAPPSRPTVPNSKIYGIENGALLTMLHEGNMGLWSRKIGRFPRPVIPYVEKTITSDPRVKNAIKMALESVFGGGSVR